MGQAMSTTFRALYARNDEHYISNDLDIKRAKVYEYNADPCSFNLSPAGDMSRHEQINEKR